MTAVCACEQFLYFHFAQDKMNSTDIASRDVMLFDI